MGGEDEGANRPGSPQRLPVDPANRIFVRRWRIGSANAAVLPVPVWAQPTRSRPSNTGGMAFSLNGGRGGIPFLLHRFEQGGHQLQVGKI